MKDKKCKSKGCGELISSSHTKSGLCGLCLMKKYRKEHKEELKKYRDEYFPKYLKKNRKEWYRKNREWYQNNKEMMLRWHKDYYKTHKEKCLEYSRNYYRKNKKKIAKIMKQYVNERYKEDEQFRIRKRLGSALNRVLFYYIKTGVIRHPLKKYNIDWEGIICALIPFPEDRHNYHVDHIIPFVAFDLTNDKQVLEVMKPENHRWLLVKDNMKKGGRQK